MYYMHRSRFLSGQGLVIGTVLSISTIYRHYFIYLHSQARHVFFPYQLPNTNFRHEPALDLRLMLF